MIIVTGFLTVAPGRRDRFLEISLPSVRQAREHPSCLDFAVSPDPIDPVRVNIAERWADRAALEGFRGSGADDEMGELILSIDIDEFDVLEA